MKYAILLVALVLLLGCTAQQSIQKVNSNPEKYLGQKVTVSGISSDSIKLGKLSGFKLTDGNESIYVSSQILPPDGKNVTVSGTLMQELLVGYYILADDVS